MCKLHEPRRIVESGPFLKKINKRKEKKRGKEKVKPSRSGTAPNQNLERQVDEGTPQPESPDPPPQSDAFHLPRSPAYHAAGAEAGDRGHAVAGGLLPHCPPQHRSDPSPFPDPLPPLPFRRESQAYSFTMMQGARSTLRPWRR